ncbi:MAG: NTP transferase domain-containing protein [Desulfovibrionales bacterium]
MKAIILVESPSDRLSREIQDIPKCLTRVGDRTILDWQLQHLRDCGIRDVVLVTGFMHEKVELHVQPYADMDFTFIRNNDFAETGSAYSLWLARHELTDDFLLLTGNEIFHPEVLRRLKDATAKNVLAVRRKDFGREDVKVAVQGATVRDVGRGAEQDKIVGEFFGAAKISRTAGPLLNSALQRAVEEDRSGCSVEKVLDCITGKVKLTAVDITDLPSIELEQTEDVQQAEENVLPCIREKERLPKILFFADRDLHLPYLEPVHDYLSENMEAELAFSAPPYDPHADGVGRMGLSPDLVDRIRKKSTFYDRAEDFQADVAVLADPCHYQVRHVPHVVNLGHGLICKGFFYNDHPISRRENLSDILCVPGPEHKSGLKRPCSRMWR